MTNQTKWWQAPKGSVNKHVLDHVQRVEQDHFDVYDRFVKLAALYDPNSAVGQDGTRPESSAFITENVIATNVDTIAAVVAGADLRARILTDDGDWSEQRMAREQELYAEGLEKQYDVEPKAVAAFHAGPGIRGSGFVYAGEDRYNNRRALCVEHVLADDIVVDERDCRNGGQPRQIHRRRLVDRDVLIARFPKFKAQIAQAQRTNAGTWQMWANYRPVQEHELIVIHSFYLPIGAKGESGYVAGRETLVVDGVDLFDAPWDEAEPPFAKVGWAPRENHYFDIGLAERIMGHQQVSNRSNWQIDRLVNLNAVPTTYVRLIDAHLASKVQRPGAVTVYKGDVPVTPTPPAISPEVYKRAMDVKVSASEESGINRMLANGAKPQGLDSGAALRELRDATTQRFATQERAYERFRRDIVLLMFACCKRLGKDAPVITQRNRFGTKRIKWSKVDLKETKVQISMASTMPRTSAGRTQFVLELAQAGIIGPDSVKRLIQYPDAEAELSLYTAALESLEHGFDAIADGEIVMPEPFSNLKMAVWRGQQKYLKWQQIGAPEEVLEALRQFVVQAAYMLAPAPAMDASTASAGPDMSAVPANDGTGGGGAPPQAALADQAMQLRAV